MGLPILEKLAYHSFAGLAIKNGIATSIVLQGGEIGDINPQYSRSPDEYEYYVIEVGRKLAHLFGVCEQMTFAVGFLSTFSPTKKMREIGINRSSHLQYNIENYLIRTQSLNDRVLQLTNAVFYLGIDQRNCKFDTVTKNLHVATTKIPSRLQKLGSILGKYRQDRNTIVHHEAYQEDGLRTLEMYYLAISETSGVEIPNMEFLPNHARSLARTLVKQKSTEFDEFNKTVFAELENLFDELLPKYIQLEKTLRVKHDHRI